ncbi:hypothetical protein [Streptomyces triticirhizae]|uniref:hypothetical protein n=1 Tax=Streptomyces triticirhizae TaxID=2483353 RepID=UPI0013158ED9|nr:hypothetical protein [Streptomyces triticirhizae]
MPGRGGLTAGRRAAAPALPLALLVALLVALTACGSDDDSGGADGRSADAGRTAASAESTPPPEEPAEPADDGVPDETLPEEELAPPDGAFTEEQREFLVERVPSGVDPGAVLDQGTAACERLGYLSRHAPEAIPDAVAEGEIPEAEAAIEHLCPEYAEFLSPAD